MECVNCGKIGHVFRDCKEPVMSFGVIAVKFVEGVPQYLMIRRRDSLNYVEFLRGKYKMDKNDYIMLLINGMTANEHARLISSSFDYLWENLWNHQNTRQFRNEYENAKRAFDTLRSTGDIYGKQLHKYIEDAASSWIEPEWGFPKGRRTLHEQEPTCALREFSEETGFPSKIVTLLRDETPLIEEYVGTNGIPYKQVYFIGGCRADIIATYQPDNHVMNREVSGIQWLPFEEAYLKIRETNREKRSVLGRIHHKIMTEDIGDKLRSAIDWTVA